MTVERSRRSVEDQSEENSIVTFQYLDKLGEVKTLRGNANKLLIKRRRTHPHKSGSLFQIEKSIFPLSMIFGVNFLTLSALIIVEISFSFW